MDVECKTITGPNSGDSDDSRSSATCDIDEGYKLMSCGIYGAWANIDGSFINDETCYAQMGSNSDSRTYVQAKARCCKVNSSIDCDNYRSSKSGTSDDSMTQTICATDEILTGYFYIYFFYKTNIIFYYI